jgi:histidinol-phosphate phosphatase family protein
VTSPRPPRPGGAAFLDRDGILIKDVHFIGRPELVELLPNAAAAVRRLNMAQWPVVVVTNQSGIARRLFTEADYERVRARIDELLAAEGARLTATYMCPHHPDYSGPCLCRKPGTELFERAANDLGLDLRRSWYVGDKLRDVSPAAALGEGRHGVLIPTADTMPGDVARARAEFSVAASLDEAVSRIIESAP